MDLERYTAKMQRSSNLVHVILLRSRGVGGQPCWGGHVVSCSFFRRVAKGPGKTAEVIAKTFRRKIILDGA